MGISTGQAGMGKVGALKGGIEKRLFRRREALCFIVLCMLSFGVVVSATLGDDFLNEKEAQLIYIADAVVANDAQKCALYKTCTAPMNCSRNTCWPQTGDVKNFICMPVSFNKYCHSSSGGPCQDKYFDYTRSFVRSAANTDFKRVLTTIGICAQRALDPPFQNISKPDSLLRVYFGTVFGSWRAFPGSDQSADECGGYDTRLRPWYRASTYVPKVVAILIDAGQSMSTTLSAGQGQGSILDAFKVIVQELLKTLSVQDYVNIIMFDSAKATPLAPAMVQVEPYQNLSDTTYLPELEPLKQALRQQKTANQIGTSNVALAIEAALSGFGTNYPEAAKIILILTDGVFAKANTSSIPTSNLTSANVKVFMYKIPQPNDDMLFLGNGSFSNQLSSVGGSFEVLGDDLLNPLLALNSFFSFTAALHATVANDSADYSILFPGYEQIQGNITTVSRPVFGANKMLLGVVGMDIFISSLGNLTDLVLSAIRDRSSGVFKPSDFVLTNGGSSQLQTELPSPEPCGAGVSVPLNGGFCPRTDTTSTIEDLACCKSCAPKDAGRGSVKLGAILGGSVAGVVAIALLGCLFMWRRRKPRPTIPPFKGPGSDEDIPKAQH